MDAPMPLTRFMFYSLHNRWICTTNLPCLGWPCLTTKHRKGGLGNADWPLSVKAMEKTETCGKCLRVWVTARRDGNNSWQIIFGHRWQTVDNAPLSFFFKHTLTQDSVVTAYLRRGKQIWGGCSTANSDACNVAALGTHLISLAGAPLNGTWTTWVRNFTPFIMPFQWRLDESMSVHSWLVHTKQNTWSASKTHREWSVIKRLGIRSSFRAPPEPVSVFCTGALGTVVDEADSFIWQSHTVTQPQE